LRDHHYAVLCPERVDLVRRRRGIKPQIDLTRSVPVARTDEGAPWLPAVATLGEMLADEAIGRGDLTVVLSNHYVRYLLVPWNDQVGSGEEYARYARIAFENVFGETAATWLIRIAPEKYGMPRLAAAIDSELAQALSRVGQNTLKLASLQPYLMAAFNRLSAGFRRRDFFFLLAEPGRVAMLAAVGGSWRTARNHAVADDAEISALVERELRLLETGDGVVPQLYVHAPGHHGLRLPFVNGIAPHALALPEMAGFSAAGDLPYSMALSAA
jgi:hypothetical protein